MKPRQKRLAIIVGGVAALAVAAGLVLNALRSNVAFFFTPTQVAAGEAPKDRVFRVGGLVKDGSMQRDQMTVRFVITDTAREVPVSYTESKIFRIFSPTIVVPGSFTNKNFLSEKSIYNSFSEQSPFTRRFSQYISINFAISPIGFTNESNW